jgi:hypothetical protein
MRIVGGIKKTQVFLALIIGLFSSISFAGDSRDEMMHTPTAEECALQNSNQHEEAYDRLHANGVIPRAFLALIADPALALTPNQVIQLKIIAGQLFSGENQVNHSYVLTGSYALAFWAEHFGLAHRAPHDIDLLIPVEEFDCFNRTFPKGSFSQVETPHIVRGTPQDGLPERCKGNAGYFSVDLLSRNGCFGFLECERGTYEGLPILKPHLLLARVQEKLSVLEVSDPSVERIAEIAKVEEDIATLRQIQQLLEVMNSSSTH